MSHKHSVCIERKGNIGDVQVLARTLIRHCDWTKMKRSVPIQADARDTDNLA